MSPSEQTRLAAFREMATMNQTQALEYHELLNKEYDADMTAVTVSTPEPVVTFTLDTAPKKRGRKKK